MARDRALACNYRPVSLKCVPCRLLEHIVCSNNMADLDEYQLLSARQHAFSTRHICARGWGGAGFDNLGVIEVRVCKPCSISKPTLFIYLAFEKNTDPFIYLIV